MEWPDVDSALLFFFFLRISSIFSLGKKKGLAVFRFAEARRRGLWASGRPIDWIDLPSPSFCPSSFIGNRIVRLIFFSHFPSPCALPASPFLSFKQMMIDQSPSPHLLPATTDSIRLVPEMADFSSNFFFLSFRLLAAGGRQLISITGCCGQECASLQVLVLAE